MNTAPTLDWDRDLSTAERELLCELLAAVSRIRYGSVEMTIHDGRTVEVNKTERIREHFS